MPQLVLYCGKLSIKFVRLSRSGHMQIAVACHADTPYVEVYWKIIPHLAAEDNDTFRLSQKFLKSE